MTPDTNTEGPAGTYGCACVHHDPAMCMAIRYDAEPDQNERCECLCHQWRDEDEEEE